MIKVDNGVAPKLSGGDALGADDTVSWQEGRVTTRMPANVQVRLGVVKG